MLYDETLKRAVLDVLDNRVSGIASTMVALSDLGYSPNKLKNTILSWSLILKDAYENVDILTKEQQDKLDRIYNKVIKM